MTTLTRTEFVGRGPELAALGESLAAALEGSPRLVLCQGEPGVGKSRLVEEFLGSVLPMGVRGAWGVAAATLGAPPYRPWRQLVRNLADVTDLPAVAAQHGLTADLAWLDPDLFDSAVRPESEHESAEDRFRHFDAVVMLLQHVTRRLPLAVVFDDMHRADEPSLVLLLQVARCLRNERLLLVVNSGDTEPLAGTLATLAREPVTRQLTLSGLPVAAVARQLASRLGREVSDAEVQRAGALTGGNPFLVQEVANAMAEPHSGPAVPMTANLGEVIGARLGRLSGDGVRLLRAAAVVGYDFSVPVVGKMVDLTIGSCLVALDEATGAALVEASTTAGNHRFSHPVVRDAIEASLSTVERLRLHRLAAEVIEQVYRQRLDPHVFDLARHWAVAAAYGDDRARATGWIERAAEEAMRRQAYEESARLYRLALDIGDIDLDEAARCRLLLGLGSALHLSSEFLGGLEACREAAGVAHQIGLADVMAEAALVTEPTFQPETDQLIRQLCEQALAALGSDRTALKARVLARLAETCVYLLDDDTAQRASLEALALAEECGHASAIVAAVHARQEACFGPDAMAERGALAERMLTLGREMESPRVALWGHLSRIDAAYERGDLGAVIRENDAAARCAQEVRGPMARWLMLRSQAVLAQAQARFDDARRLAVKAFDTIAPIGDPSAPIVWAGFLSTTGHHVGYDTATLASNGLADDTLDRVEFPTAGVIQALAPAQVLAEVGRLREAASIYRSLGAVGEWRPTPHATLFTLALGILLAARLEAYEDVAVLRQRLSAYRGHHVVSGVCSVAYFGPVELWLGVAAAHLDLLDDAVAELEHAAKLCAVAGAAGFHAEAQYELASVLARRARPGDATRARALAAESARQAVALGMPPIAAKAGRLIERLEAVHPSQSLTRREWEVAALVGEGLTNRQIAARLYLSERTAQNHVQHILDKLNLPNRSQIAVMIAGEN